MSFLVGAGASLVSGLFGGGSRKKAEKRAFEYRKKELDQQVRGQFKLQQSAQRSTERQQRKEIGSQQLMQQVSEAGETGRLGMSLGSQEKRLGMQTASTERIATEAQQGETSRLGMNLDTQKTMQQEEFRNQTNQKAQDAARARLAFAGRFR